MIETLCKAWEGRIRLPVTYWLLGVGGNMSFVALLIVLYVLAGRDTLFLLWLVYLLSFAWFIFIFVAIWRSAGSYPGPPVWATLARAGVCIGIVRMAGEAILLSLL